MLRNFDEKKTVEVADDMNDSHFKMTFLLQTGFAWELS